jgi:hypothetical protein
MIGQSRTNARKLLSVVNGKPHAGAEDHEPLPARPNIMPEQEKMDLLAEPVSSDDEPNAPPLRPSTPPKRTQQAKRASTDSVRHSQRQVKKNLVAPRAPRTGAFAKSQAEKEKRAVVEDKENAALCPSSSGSERDRSREDDVELAIPPPKKRKPEQGLSRAIITSPQPPSLSAMGLSAPPPKKQKSKSGPEEKLGDSMRSATTTSSEPSIGSQEDNPWGFGVAHLPVQASKKRKTTPRARTKPITNLHTAATKGGVKKQYGKAAQRKDMRVTGLPGSESDSDLLDAEILTGAAFEEALKSDGLAVANPKLSKCDYNKKSRTAPENKELAKPPLTDKHLRNCDIKKKGQTQQRDEELAKPPLIDRELEESDNEETLNTKRKAPDPLDQWKQDQALVSSQPEADTPEAGFEDFHAYFDKLPQEVVEGSICPICKAPIEREDYWEFWTGKDDERTYKNQSIFCLQHRTKSAEDEYKRKRYPAIDWSALPQRIKKHRMELFRILKNDQLSEYRDRYEPIARTGKAAAVPSRRKDLPEEVQEKLESYALDDKSTYPGYYGPHGRRVMTECVMRLLKNEIKQCSDPVVQGSGPATFVQAVLVPEMAILLISEDCQVDKAKAEEIREKTYEMGLLLNLEIEDDVEAHDRSDDENEYGGR